MGKIGMLNTDKSIEAAIREIRHWLSMIGVDGLSIDTRYDPAKNVALVRFRHEGKSYEFRSTKQNNSRLQMWAIARVMENKVRAQLMGIEDFQKAMQAYLLIEGSTDQGYAPQERHVTETAYAVLGISPTASNDEIEKRYKTLIKGFHPDLALSNEAKEEFGKRAADINAAYSTIKTERGFK